jgi:hypothetical protein
MNALTKDVSSLLTGLQRTSTQLKTAGGASGENYMRFARTGDWVYGPEAVAVDPDSLWAIDPMRFTVGYIAWGVGEVLGEMMRLAQEPPVLEADLPDVGAAWSKQVGCALMCIKGEDTGTRCTYSTNSKGGLRAVNNLLGEVAARLEKGEADRIIPVVRLGADSYKHKQYGTIYTPELSIVDWASMSDEPEKAAEEVKEEEVRPRRRRVV